MTTAVFIVRLSVAASEFRERLRAIEGAVLVRELPPGRVVVAAAPEDARRLAALDGVEAVVRDRLEHLDGER